MKKIILLAACLLFTATACTRSNNEESVHPSEQESAISIESTDNTIDSSEDNTPLEQGGSSPEDIIETVVAAQFKSDNSMLVSVFSEFIKIGMRGTHPEYTDNDLANLLGMTWDTINEYRYNHFLDKLIIDSIDEIELDSAFAKTTKAAYESAGLDFSSVTRIAEVHYTVESTKSAVKVTRSESNYCAEIDGKWYLLYWEGNLYGE
ncbi:MAG: hypothetical protein CVU97_00650 [Firmicutes bacterium HGW-Firmicutes-21]|nr:MAG: hypothetical protein CVU97_00650 [Firmicutes bacterium HGW-Firmicutes-21]